MTIALLAGLGLLLIALGAFLHTREQALDQARLSERLQAVAGESVRHDAANDLLQERTYSAIPQLNALLRGRRFTRWFGDLVGHAGIQRPTGEMVLWMGLAGGIAAWVAFVALRCGFLLAVVAGGAGPLVVLAWLRRRRTQRRELLVRQLPDALDMIRSALQAGHGLQHAVELVAQEGPDPLAGEFRRLIEQLRLGEPVKRALEGLYGRTGVPDLRFFSISVLLNREVGGNLTDIIDVVAETIRERFKLKAQVRALTAQGRLSALVLTALAPLLLVVLSVLSAEYVAPLYQTGVGNLLLAYAATSVAIGYACMRRLTAVRVLETDR